MGLLPSKGEIEFQGEVQRATVKSSIWSPWA
jgi:hypothetical protein